MTPAAINLVDRLIAIYAATFTGQPPQQTTLRIHINATRDDLATLRDMRAREEEGR